jgi:hypothetical protein
VNIDFDGVEELADFVTVPAGTYLCKIADVQTGSTRAGDVRWGLRLVVAEGEFTGRQAAWDGLIFSTRGMPRVRSILGALGLPNSGKVEVSPDDLVGCAAFVEVRPAEFRNPDTGNVVRRNEVPYNGYRAVQDDDSAPTPTSGDRDSMPF